MLLQEVAARFCNTPVYYYSGGQWLESCVRGRIPPYDRFISDRAFGQKKRLLQTPGGQLLPASDYYRVGGPDRRTYMVESLNEDLDEYGAYLNVYMIREVQDVCAILVQDRSTTRPSGVAKSSFVVHDTVWVDLDRFGVLRSDELEVDYTSYTITLPKGVVVPDDCRLRIDGKLYAVTEDFTQMQLRQLRVRGIG